jgi:hypothetical protein
MINLFPTHKEIAACAYFIYLKEGRPAGRQKEHWRQAEAQLIADRLVHDALPALIFGNSDACTAALMMDASY